LIREFDKLWSSTSAAFKQARIGERARSLGYGVITCLGRHTLTGMLTASGRQFTDWSSAYRIFGKGRVNTEIFFDTARKNVLQELSSDQLIIAHLDDTIIKKTGKKIPGAAWRRDPLGPPFHTNFIWGQRFLQISLALPHQEGQCQSKAIPVDFHHCPTVKKPASCAGPQQLQAFKEHQRIAKLSKQGSLRIQELRNKLNAQGAEKRQLIMGVDGSYTNKTVLKSLPEGVTIIGRIRKDAKLYEFPEHHNGVGRKKVYGNQLPTPEQIRKSDEFSWEKVKAWAAGKLHDFDIKVIRKVRWRTAGRIHELQLVVIRPLGYRLTKNSKVLYREPAYLICTDSTMALDKLLQAYIWRWEIEVNFRDEKTIFGCGQAQVRNEKSVKNLPAFITAMYSFMHLAAHRACQKRNESILPRPKWYPAKPEQRITSSEIVNLFRTQLWLKEAKNNFSAFVKKQYEYRSLKKTTNPLTSAIFYTRK
jgi:hypothetical protein